MRVLEKRLFRKYFAEKSGFGVITLQYLSYLVRATLYDLKNYYCKSRLYMLQMGGAAKKSKTFQILVG